MFEQYATGRFSLRDLEVMLAKKGLRNRRGNRLHRSSIALLLKNPFYVGDFLWTGKRYHGKHAPLIDKALFDRTQAVTARRNDTRSNTRSFAYTGLLKCAHCGSSVTAEIKKDRYVYYHCTFDKGHCGGAYVREEELERQFERIFAGIEFPEVIVEWIRQALRQSRDEQTEFHGKAIEKLTAEYAKLQNRINQIYLDKLDEEEAMARVHIPHLTDNYHEIAQSIPAIMTVFGALYGAIDSSLGAVFQEELHQASNGEDYSIVNSILEHYQSDLGPQYVSYAYLLIITATIEKNRKVLLQDGFEMSNRRRICEPARSVGVLATSQFDRLDQIVKDLFSLRNFVAHSFGSGMAEPSNPDIEELIQRESTRIEIDREEIKIHREYLDDASTLLSKAYIEIARYLYPES